MELLPSDNAICAITILGATGDAGAADVLYGTTFAMFGQSPMMPKPTVVEDYVKRIVARPAYAPAQAMQD